MIFDTICAKSHFSIDFARHGKYFMSAKVLRDQKSSNKTFKKNTFRYGEIRPHLVGDRCR